MSLPTQASYVYFTVCGRVSWGRAVLKSLLNRNTHTVDEQRCIVRVECGPSYRFAYLLLPLQDVRHRDIFREVHLTVKDDALAKDRRDVHSILVVLMAGYCRKTPQRFQYGEIAGVRCFVSCVIIYLASRLAAVEASRRRCAAVARRASPCLRSHVTAARGDSLLMHHLRQQKCYVSYNFYFAL